MAASPAGTGPASRWVRRAEAPLSPDQVASNIRNLVAEIAWFGVLWGAVINYLQVYVVRLGASPLLVGAITYGPALIGIIWQLPGARLMLRAGHRMHWVVWAGFVYRLTFFLIPLAPWLLERGVAEVTVAIAVLQAIPATLSNTSFLSMLADAVPTGRLVQVVGWRLAGFGLTNTLTTLAVGQLLKSTPFPLGYQLAFLAGASASMVSWWHLTRLEVPNPAQSSPGPGSMREDLGDVMRYPGYAGFLAGVFAVQLALGMAAPLLPLFWVRGAGATDAQISVVVTTFSAAMVAGSLLTRRVVGRIGRESALAAGALGYACYPLLTPLAPSVAWLVPCAAIGGYFTATLSVTLFDNLVSVTPEADRTRYISAYNLTVNAALFIGPVIAALLARRIGPGSGLLVAGVTALGAAVLLVRRRPAARWGAGTGEA